MKNNKVKFIFVALLFATQVEAFSSCSTSSVNEENKEQITAYGGDEPQAVTKTMIWVH